MKNDKKKEVNDFSSNGYTSLQATMNQSNYNNRSAHEIFEVCPPPQVYAEQQKILHSYGNAEHYVIPAWHLDGKQEQSSQVAPQGVLAASSGMS